MLTMLAQTTVVDHESNVALDTVDAVTQELGGRFNDGFQLLVEMAPRAIAAVLLLVLGYVVARVLARLAAALCETVGLQTAAERSGLADSMKQVGVKRNVPAVIGLIVFWLLLSVAIMTAFHVLGLEVVSDAMQQVVNFIPKLLVATVVVVVGLLIASFVRGVIATSADRVGVTYAEQLATGCYYLLALMTFIAAFQQLDFQFPLLERMLLIAFAAVALGFGLAFGLGGRDVMGGILSGYYVRQRFQAGDEVRLGSLVGTVREVGPVATIIESEEDGLLHRHSIPNHVMLKEGIR